MESAASDFDYLLVGGGLANALIALSLFAERPAARVGLIEREERLGGNHVWCFHSGDLDAEGERLVAPLVEVRWPRYEVRFPELVRLLEDPYAAVSSDRLHQVLTRAFATDPERRVLRLGQRAVKVEAREVTLGTGEKLRARVVIEGRGPAELPRTTGGGFQKFVGLELLLDRPFDLLHPLLMDATVTQRDGLRFVYVLPFESRRVLVEDTYFSDSPELDVERLEQEVRSYARELGMAVSEVRRRETGVLPLPSSIRADENPAADGPIVVGYQGGFFHPVTGYSFPVAARLARALARSDPEQLRSREFPRLLREQRAQLRFCLLLNRLLYTAFASEDRRNVLERFYRLPPDVIRRFYALTLSHTDRARILCGRPPRGFSMKRALSQAVAS